MASRFTVRQRIEALEQKIDLQQAVDARPATKQQRVRKAGVLSWWPGRRSSEEQPAIDRHRSKLVSGLLPHPIGFGLLADECMHRELGLWAFDSVNANAWSTLFKYVQRSAADFVVGQEAKLPAGDLLTSAESSLRCRGWRGKISPCVSGPGGGHSAGTVVASRSHVGLAEAAAGTVCHVERLQLQWIGAVCRGGMHLGFVYLHDMVGPAHPSNLDILDFVAQKLKLLSGP